jgi:glucose dehydrogenase
MLTSQERYQPITCSAFLLFACLLLSGLATATPSITLSKTSGPPTSRILVSGSGFEANVGVDIFFDTKDKALAVTNAKGEFHDATIFAPRGSHPGEHWVTALERNNDRGAQKPFLVQTNWSQFWFDPDGTRLNPYENVLSSRVVSSRGLDVRWTYTTGSLVQSSPAVANGVAYVGSWDHNVYALNASTGALLWKYATGYRVESSPAIADGLVFVGSDDYKVYALNAKTGAKVWSYTTGYQVYSSPAVVDGVVYVGSGDGNVYALEAKTGKKLWNYTADGGVYASPAVINGVVYVSGNATLYALNARTGAKLWSDTPFYSFSSPVVANGIVYDSSGYTVYALDASNGGQLWSFATGYIWGVRLPSPVESFMGAPETRMCTHWTLLPVSSYGVTPSTTMAFPHLRSPME